MCVRARVRVCVCMYYMCTHLLSPPFPASLPLQDLSPMELVHVEAHQAPTNPIHIPHHVSVGPDIHIYTHTYTVKTIPDREPGLTHMRRLA